MMGSAGSKGGTAQELDVLVKKRKWKNRLSIAAAAAVVIAVAAVSVGNYVKTRQAASEEGVDESGRPGNPGGNLNGDLGVVMATGTTSVGMDAVTFGIDFLEDTDLYVEEVYLSNGDSVKAGDKYIKFTEESIADARAELESAKIGAQLAYRSGKVSDGESRLRAKHTYDMAMFEAQTAQQVYDDTVAQLDADYAQALKAYEEAQQEYDEYLGRVQNNSFGEYYDIAGLKKAYEEAKALYVDQKAYCEVSDDELESASSAGTSGTKGKGAQNERAWTIKAVSLLKQEADEAEEAYESALEEYENEIASAQLKLQKLQSALETAREDFVDAEVSYQKKSLSAKTAYETAVAKGKTAQADYDTQLESLDDSLGRLGDAMVEANGNLALFETLVGDGYLHMEESGTVRMLMAEKGKALTGGSMVFAYSNPERISVSVSVGQDDIAKLYVGEMASVDISGHGNYSGVVGTINPISSSNGRSSVSYTVTVNLTGDVKGLDSNLTANVTFGESEVKGEGYKDGQSGQKERKANDAQD